MSEHVRCTHGLPPADEAAFRAYSERQYCLDQGDCRCPVCALHCWRGECRPPRDARCAAPTSMSDEMLLEQAAATAHRVWWELKVAQGYHLAGSCSGPVFTLPNCERCHKGMRPYVDLDEPTKERRRAHVRAMHAVYFERIATLEAALRKEQERVHRDCGRRDDNTHERLDCSDACREMRAALDGAP